MDAPAPSPLGPAPIPHDAFYRFAPVPDPDALAARLRPALAAAGVLGSVQVAREGINGMLAGDAAELAAAREALRAAPGFRDLAFRRTPCAAPPFGRLKVRARAELVPLGRRGPDGAPVDGALGRVGLVPPERWRELLDDPDVVVIDNRNRFEARLGRFRGAVPTDVRDFAEFADWFDARRADWEGRRIAMYCTGGIRCEKTAAWLRLEGIEALQLEGGVLGFFEGVPAPERDWEGELFVFDRRVALGPDGRETGRRPEDVDES